MAGAARRIGAFIDKVSRSRVRAAYELVGVRTQVARVHESGALRLRHPRGAGCEAVLVNTAGGIVGGDRLALEIGLGDGAVVTLTSAAAEKIYRSTGAATEIATSLRLEAGSRLAWLPQETILFDGARLERRLGVEMAADAGLVALEIVVFGRLGFGERMLSGHFRDGWRVRRGGRLVFADATRLDGEIGAALDRTAVGAGARAVGLLLVVSPDAIGLDPTGSDAAVGPALERLDRARRAMMSYPEVEAGASTRHGLLVARLAAKAPERLRAAAAAVVQAVRGEPMPRGWL